LPQEFERAKQLSLLDSPSSSPISPSDLVASTPPREMLRRSISESEDEWDVDEEGEPKLGFG
jgi:hypothetical protein